MNQKITDIIKCNTKGSELLAAMKIDDNTKATKEVLEGIKEALRLIGEGKSPQEAAEMVTAKAQMTIVKSQNGKLAAGQAIPAEVGQEIGDIVAESAMEDLDELPGAIATYTTQASQRMQTGVQGLVDTNYFGTITDGIKTAKFKEQVRSSIKKLKSQQSGAKS